MRRVLTAATAALFMCGSAVAQVGGMGGIGGIGGIGATSPLGMTPGSPVGPTGIPLGATELQSPGISPMPPSTMGTVGIGTVCPSGLSPASPSPASSGSNSFDGGGVAMGLGLSPPGSIATQCVTAPIDASSAASSAAAPTGGARTGIPLGSVEIGNSGVSPAPIVQPPAFSSPGSTPCVLSGSSTSSVGC